MFIEVECNACGKLHRSGWIRGDCPYTPRLVCTCWKNDSRREFTLNHVTTTAECPIHRGVPKNG